MSEFLTGSVFFGSFLSLFAFVIGLKCRARWNHPLANPMLIAIVLTLAVLLIFDIDYDSYYAGAKYISYFLTPATVCLAIPLYEQFLSECERLGFPPQHGEFGADMLVTSENHGPVTLIVDTNDLK